MKMKKIYKILLLIAVCIIAVSGCKKEDKVSGTRIYYTCLLYTSDAADD